MFGAIAQLGERLPCTQEVRSSILLGSTTSIEPSALLKVEALGRGYFVLVKAGKLCNECVL